MKKEIDDTPDKHIRNLLRLKKENEAIKDTRNLFEHEEEDYYKPVRKDNLRSNNYTEYESKHCTLINALRKLDHT